MTKNLPNTYKIIFILLLQVVATLIYLFFIRLFTSPPSGIAGWSIAVYRSIPISCGILWALSRPSTINCLWRKLPLLNTVFPNINGRYSIHTNSNWPKKQAMLNCLEGKPYVLPDEKNSVLEKFGELIIKQGLFNLTISYFPKKTEDSTTNHSYVVKGTATINKEENAEIWNLFYIYKSEVYSPKSTDESSYFGAVKLRFKVEKTPPNKMEGNYWTNRSWQLGVNTAGTLILEKISSKQ